MLGFKREKKDEDDSRFEVSDKIDKRLTAGTPNRKFQQGSITLSFTPTTVDVATKLNVTDRITLVHETRTERRQLVTPTRCRTHRYRRKHLKASIWKHRIWKHSFTWFSQLSLFIFNYYSIIQNIQITIQNIQTNFKSISLFYPSGHIVHMVLSCWASNVRRRMKMIYSSRSVTRSTNAWLLEHQTRKKNQQGSITLSFTPRTVDVATNLNVTDRTTLVQETIKCHTASLQDTQISTEASESIASLGSSRNYF